jgi:hypothetical protein
MHQRSLKRLLVIALLAGGLAFAGPTQVHAAPFTSSPGLWNWLSRVWGEGVTVLWERPGSGHGKGIPEKGGGCIDPNGCLPHAETPAAGPTCHAWNDAGGCIDPNG